MFVTFSPITVGRGFPVSILVLQILSTQIPEYMSTKYEDLPGSLEGQSCLGDQEVLIHPEKLIKGWRVAIGKGEHKEE